MSAHPYVDVGILIFCYCFFGIPRFPDTEIYHHTPWN